MWYEEAVFYQVFPLGFCDGLRDNDGVMNRCISEFADWIPHLQKLGIDAVYFSPLFESDYHGYDTRDYRVIDKRIGTNKNFAELVSKLHEAGIKVVIDGVFNHVGRGFFAFKDVCEKKWDSVYKDWFNISFDGNSTYNDGFWYEGWEGHYELVKLNLDYPDVQNYLLSAVDYWIDAFDIDGIRLDVAYSLPRWFMAMLKDHCRQKKADFFLLGEVLGDNAGYMFSEAHLDSITDYPGFKGLWSSFNSLNMFEMAHTIKRNYGEMYRGQTLFSFVDNHDVERIASKLTDLEKLPLIYGMLFSLPGIPCIYYGSEWGEEGVKAPDNDYALRPCFEEPKPNELTDFIKELIEVRRNSDSLCNGSYRNVVITNHQLIFERRTDNERVLVAINAGDSEFTAGNGELQGNFTELLANADEIENITLNGQLTMPAYSVQFLKAV